MITVIKPDLSIRSFLIVLFVSSLLFSGISTFAAGLSWLIIFVSGIFVWTLSKKRSVMGGAAVENRGNIYVKYWFFSCLAYFLFFVIPTFYWGGSWPERHPQMRLLLGSLGLWLFLLYGEIRIKELQLFIIAIGSSLFLTFFLVIFKGAYAGPTNPIPWIAGISMISCSLLVAAYQFEFVSKYLKNFLLLSGLIGVFAVFFSGVRGSWGGLFVFSFGWYFLQKNHIKNTDNKNQKNHIIFYFFIIFCILLGFFVLPQNYNPFARIQSAVLEFNKAFYSEGVIGGGSVGLRIGLYKFGYSKIPEYFSVFGVGYIGQKAILNEFMVNYESGSLLGYIGHYHNEFLNAIMEFGFFGVLGYISLPVGLLLVGYLAWVNDKKTLSIGLFMLVTQNFMVGLTNVNSAHNYYPIMFFLSIAILLTSEVFSGPYFGPQK